MHCIALIIFVHFILRVGCVPSGLTIKNGREAGDDEYPFIVRLERRIILEFDEKNHVENNVHICTCVAVSPSWTLTAGHCIDSAAPRKDLSDNLRIRTFIRYGSHNSTTAEVISTIQHPSYHDPLLKLQNNIGLLRTEIMSLKQFAHISDTDINTLGGQQATLAAYTNTAQALRVAAGTAKETPLQLLTVVIVRYDSTNKSTLPAQCEAHGCSSASRACAGDAGGPMLLPTGVVGINTISMESIKLCSALHRNQPIGIQVIAPTKPHIKWIDSNIKRDAVLF